MLRIQQHHIYSDIYYTDASKQQYGKSGLVFITPKLEPIYYSLPDYTPITFAEVITIHNKAVIHAQHIDKEHSNLIIHTD